jgi:hypothetical protein
MDTHFGFPYYTAPQLVLQGFILQELSLSRDVVYLIWQLGVCNGCPCPHEGVTLISLIHNIHHYCLAVKMGQMVQAGENLHDMETFLHRNLAMLKGR